jgi:hypothetical protein
MSNKKEPRIDHSVSPKRDILVVPPGARGPESMHPAHVAQPPSQTQVVPDDSGVKALDITKLVKRKEDEKRLKKKLEKRLQKQKEKGDVAGKAKKSESPLSSSSSISSISPVSLSPNEILAFEEEQRLEAKSVSPRLSPLVRGTGVGARARKKPSSSSSSSKSPKGRKPLTPKFEKFESKSLSPKARGKGKDKDKVKGKEGTKRQGGASGTRKKYKRKLRKINSRKRR